MNRLIVVATMVLSAGLSACGTAHVATQQPAAFKRPMAYQQSSHLPSREQHSSRRCSSPVQPVNISIDDPGVAFVVVAALITWELLCTQASSNELPLD